MAPEGRILVADRQAAGTRVVAPDGGFLEDSADGMDQTLRSFCRTHPLRSTLLLELIGAPAVKAGDSQEPGWNSYPYDRPTAEGAHTVLVEALEPGEDFRFRHLAWVQDNRESVDEASDGRIGYVYVPNTVAVIRQHCGIDPFTLASNDPGADPDGRACARGHRRCGGDGRSLVIQEASAPGCPESESPGRIPG